MTERVVFPAREFDRAPIVLIDTDPESRSIVRGALNAAGAQRINAILDPMHLKQLASDEVAMLVLNMDVAGVGSALCRAVRHRRTQVQRGIPLLGYAQNPTVDILRSALMSGLDAILAPPFTGQAVRAKILGILDRPKPLIVSAAYVGPDHSKLLKSLVDFLDRAKSISAT